MNYNRINDFKNKDGEEYTGATRIESTRQSREYTDDYILPDYLPDAKKVLEFTCRPVIESRFVGNSSVEYNGSLYCRALYLSEQSELGVATFTLPFEDKLSNENITDDCVDIILPGVYSSSCRLQNPRKLNIRVKAGADIELWKRRSYMPELYGAVSREDEKSVQTNPKLYECMWVLGAREDEMTLSEDITVDKSMADIDSVILCRSDIRFDECRGGNNEIICKGSCSFECLYKGSDGQYCFLRRSIPVSENISANKVSDNSSCIVYANCKLPDVTVREDEFGQRRVMELDIEYSVEAVCFNDKKIWLTDDSYSTVKEVQNSHERTTVYSNGDKITGGFSVNESLMLDDAGFSANEKIISYSCCPAMELMGEPGKKGKLNFEGECEFSLLVQKADGSVYPVTFKLPIKYESDRPAPQTGSYEGKCSARASNVRLRTDNEKVYTDFEISFCSVIIQKEDMELLESIRLLPSAVTEQRPRSVITLCYPSSGDDEWCVAKKYRITREALSYSNSMNQEMPSVLKIPSNK